MYSALFSQTFIVFITEFSQSTISTYISASKLKHSAGENKRKKYDFITTRQISKNLYSKKYKTNKKIHVFFHLKTGTGKTTICIQLASLLSLLGFNVLLIDADSQACLTHYIGINEDRDDILTLQDIINNKTSIEKRQRKRYIPVLIFCRQVYL